MKVILNQDLATLGEEGDVKDVAKGYARNYLFPRGIALPYNESTIRLFEARKEEIEARKVQKRQDASGLKEKLEALTLLLTMPAGPNGKLYGAVTAQTVADELVKQGFQIERKKIELPGNTLKSVGKYKVTVKLYESAAAECTLTVEGQAIKTETRAPAPQRGRRRGNETPEASPVEAEAGQAPIEAPAPAPADVAAAPEAAAPVPEAASPADAPAVEAAAPVETAAPAETDPAASSDSE
jgi:large subunit ribosomal protein L9